MGVFEVGEKVGTHLPAVAPSLDVRRGERGAEIVGHAQNQRLPVLPGGFVVGFDFGNGFGAVFFQLGKLEKRALKQRAVLGCQHDVGQM